MDVRQLALLARQPSAAVKPREHFCGMPKRGLAFILANALFWQPLLAQADGIVVSAPGTSLGQAGNGVPIVNIAKPNASGLSHNQFHDYNVGANGVILNNATHRTQSTQLGGIILGNPNLNGTAAQTILNEVNGGSPSQLRGYTEVAGQSARVIVANPYGISCNGCGFINTPRVTLTTGKPVLDNGRLERFQVDQGSVSIDGLGLDASSVDSFEIITRSAKINAQINARNLTVVAGRNDVNADSLNATARADDGSAKPELAIDSTALGGMYAGAIKLVGTEAGVGVKLDGTLAASGGDIQLDANGHLSMAQTAASGAINVKAASLDSTGPVYAGTRLDMQTSGAMNNRHNLVARDSITLTSAGQLTNNGIIEAGVNADNSRNATGDVSLSARNLNNSGKRVIASRNLTATATQTLTNRGGTLSAQQQTKLTVGALDNQSGSLLGSAIAIDFGSATGDLNNSAGLIATAGQLSISHLRDLNNQQGEISSSQSFTLAGRTLDNSAGKLVSNNVLTLNAVSLLNQRGLASGWQGLTVSGGSLDNRNSGTLSSRYGDIGVTLSGALLNSGAGALVSQKALTVKAASLDNSAKGILSSGAEQTLIVGGLLNNAQGGSIDSGAGLQLTAARLDNAKGTVQSQKGLNLDISGDLDNQSGVITAQTENLILKAANADNRGGALLSLKGLLQTRIVGVLRNGYDLNNNRQGGIIQAQLLDLRALGGIDNYGGSITAQSGDAIVNTGAGDFDNRNGGLYAKQRVSVTGNDFDNSGDNDGQIAGQQITLDLSGALNNRLGIIESDSSLKITAASLDNQNGQIRALGASGTTEFQIGGLFDNRNGILETANTDLTLAAGSFQNVGGSLLHVGIGTFAISLPNVTGAGGSIVTRGGLTLEGDSATNSSSIQAGRLTVNVDNFNQTTSGQLLASDSFTGTGTHWSNDGLIASKGSLSLKLKPGSIYEANGRLSSLGVLELKAGQVNLRSNASIAGGGDTTINVAGLFSNYGRLTSTANLGLTAGSVGNYGTLGSAQDLTVTTGALLNDHALIFSGDDMSLRVDTLTNSYADVYSLGNLSIDRDGQGTLAGSIVNSSASIQSDGNMSLAASTIQNIRAVLTTNNQGIYTASITELRCIEGYNAGDCSGGKENHVWQILQRDKFEVTAASAASSITAGGNLSITGADLLNQSSTIATGGNLTASLNNLSNSGIETGETETTRVFRSERTRNPESWIDAANTFTHKYWYQSAGYTPNDLGGLEAAMSRFIGRTEREVTQFASSKKLSSDDQSYAAVIQAAGTVNITAQNNFDNSVVRPGYNYVGSGPRTDTTAASTNYSTRITLNQQLPPDLAQQQVNPLTLPGFSLPTGQNGLFRLSTQGSTSTDTTPQGWTLGLPASTGRSAPNKYLIETDPALTDLRQFMSSDYLLEGLGYDPDDSAKRLGDGFYEQRLIQQAVVARTGQRLLAGQTTDEALFKYLMNNAIASKQQLDLALGVTLTSEQVAALTHDIVWLENQQVNGEQVLVPVLYLAQANNRLAANGALIQGSDVSLIVGKDLNNAGTLRASNNLSGIAGNDLLNRGLVEAGNRLDLLASNNLVNKAGGIIAGRDVGLIAVNGDVINERTVTRHQSSNGHYSQQRDFVDSAARIEAANDLTIRAGRDFNNSGGVLKSGADATIDADRDVNITSAEQLTSNNRGANHRNQTITQHGSSIDVGRDLTINAGRNLTAIGSQIDAKRDIAMSAVGDLTLASAADEQHSYSKSKKVTSQEDHVSQVSTAVTAGGSVALSAGKDLSLIGSRVSAGDEAYLVAGANLKLQSAEDSDYSFYSKTKKSSSGKKSQLDEVASTTNVGSLVTSGSNSVLVAGQDLLIKGSGVTAEKGGAQLVAGNDVQIVAVTDSSSARHERSSSKSSWGGFKSSKVKDQLSETQTEAVGSMVSGDTVSVAAGRDVAVKGSSLVSTADLTVQAGRDLTIDAAENTFTRTQMHKEKNRDLSGILTGNNGGLDDITGNQHLSIGTQKHNGNAQETTLTGSTIGSSEGNVQLIAGRGLKVVASALVSTKDMTLSGSDVTIAAGTETAKQSSTDKSNSLAVGRVVGGMVIDTAKSIRDNVRAAQNADDDRLKAVKTAQAVLAAYNLYTMGQDASDNINEGKPANSSGSLIKIGTELGSTHSKSTSKYSSETAKQSSLTSGAGLAIIATGKAAGSAGDIHVIGSTLKAEDTLLVAKNDITLESAQNRKEWDNQDSHNKTAIGASFNIGAQNGFTLDLGAQTAKGMGTGSELTQVNSTVDTGRLVLKSGQDTTLAGAQVRADRIDADIGGNLNISSRQDEASQVNRQQSGGFGGSICIPPICYGAPVTASANIAASKMDSAYKAVIEQTGLFAGNGGYNINVGATTVLHGAVIASDATADKNKLSTDRLIVSDIKNSSEIKSQAAGVSISYSGGWDGGGKPGIGGSIPLMLKDSDHSSTRSAVSDGAITVRNPAGANDLVGLNRDTANANQKLDRPDEKAMQERMDLIQGVVDLAKGTLDAVVAAKQKDAAKLDHDAKTPEQKQAAKASIAEAARWDYGGDKRIMADIATGLLAAGLGGAGGATGAGIVANTTAADTYKKIGDYANKQYNGAKDSATKAAWAEGGAARILLHTLAGAAQGLAGGNVQGSAMGAATSAALMPVIGKALENNGVISDGQNAWAALIATSLGGAAGSGGGLLSGIAGGRAGAGVEIYNRQLHPDEVKFLQDKDRIARFIKQVKEKTGEDLNPDQATKVLSQGGAALADAHWTDINGTDLITQAFIREEAAKSGLAYQDVDGRMHLYFVTTPEEYRNETINMKVLFDAYGGKGSSVEKYLSDNFVQEGQNTWRERYRAGQEFGLADANKNYEGTGGALLGVAVDIGAIIAGLVQTPFAIGESIVSDEVGPLDSTRMADYYQKLLHIQSRATEAGYIAESDYATSQRLMLLGLPISELGGLALLKAFQTGGVGSAASLAIAAEKKALEARRIELNFGRDAEGFGQAAQRDFAPGKEHRAENINAGQVTDRDGLPRVDDVKTANEKLLAEQRMGGKALYWGTQRPAWKEGTIVTDKVLDKPRTMTMVIDLGQYEKMAAEFDLGLNPSKFLGGWATDTPISSLADVRNKLAISEEFKVGQLYQVEFTVKPGVGVREGAVGDMWDAKNEVRLPGGGHQVNFMDKPPRTNSELYEVNMKSLRALK